MSTSLNKADVLAAHLRSAIKIPREEVASWMAAPDIEVLGVLYDAISDPAIVRRVEPALSGADAQEFLRFYFGRCLRENPRGAWADSRYSAAWDAAGWLKASWGSLSEPERDQWKNWLAGLYREDDASLREALETGLLEHIFSNKQIANYFSDWGRESTLCEGYRASLAVAKGILGRST